MGLRETSIIWKITFAIQILALILALTGFGSNFIIVYSKDSDKLHAGLWKFCTSEQCLDTEYVLKNTGKNDSWLKASKTMMSIALVLEFVSILMTSMAICRTILKLERWANSVVGFISAVFGLIGVGVAAGEGIKTWKKEAGYSLDLEPAWSFTLFMIAQGTFIGCSLLHLIDIKCFPPATSAAPV